MWRDIDTFLKRLWLYRYRVNAAAPRARVSTKPSRAELLDGISDENIHPETDMGPKIGLKIIHYCP